MHNAARAFPTLRYAESAAASRARRRGRHRRHRMGRVRPHAAGRIVGSGRTAALIVDARRCLDGTAWADAGWDYRVLGSHRSPDRTSAQVRRSVGIKRMPPHKIEPVLLACLYMTSSEPRILLTSARMPFAVDEVRESSASTWGTTRGDRHVQGVARLAPKGVSKRVITAPPTQEPTPSSTMSSRSSTTRRSALSSRPSRRSSPRGQPREDPGGPRRHALLPRARRATRGERQDRLRRVVQKRLDLPVAETIVRTHGRGVRGRDAEVGQLVARARRSGAVAWTSSPTPARWRGDRRRRQGRRPRTRGWSRSSSTALTAAAGRRPRGRGRTPLLLRAPARLTTAAASSSSPSTPTRRWRPSRRSPRS